MEKTIDRLSWLFLLIGLGLLAWGGYLASRTAAFVGSAGAAEGTVVAFVQTTSTDGPTYQPIVAFTPASGGPRKLTSDMGASPPAYDVGDKVTVLYDPADPGDARIESTFALWGGAIILCGVGTAFAAVGGGMLGVRRAATRRTAELRLRGRRVLARFQSVERNTSFEVNGVHPWRIVCQWQDPTTGVLHLFQSANLWSDPTPHVHVQEIAVFVDPRNPRRYAMDVGFLPRAAE